MLSLNRKGREDAAKDLRVAANAEKEVDCSWWWWRWWRIELLGIETM